MLYNKFLGQSRELAGASYLNINPIVKVKEGYITNGSGATTEFVNVGDYRVISVSNYGYDSQKINLNAKNEIGMMGYDRRVFSNRYDGGFYYYTDFNNEEVLKDWTFTDSGYWGISNGLLQRGVSTPPAFAHAMLTLENGLENFMIRTKFRCSVLASASYGGVGVAFKMQDNTQTSSKYPNTEIAWFLKEITWARATHHVYVDGSYIDSQSGQSITFADNNWYDFKVYVNRGTVAAYYRANVATDWIECVNKGNVARYVCGAVGLATYGYWNGIVEYDNFEVQELKGNNTRYYILDDFAKQRDNVISIDNEFSGLSDFSGIDGATFTVGITNGYQQLDFHAQPAGNTFMVALSNGYTFNDFTVDFEFRGPSSSFGVAVGTTAGWHGHYITSFSGGGGMALGTYGSSRDWYANPTRGPNVNMWTKGRLTKKGQLSKFYMNGDLVSIYSATYLPNNGNSVGFGFCCYRAGFTNAYFSFRNVRISELDDTMDDVEFSATGNVANDFDRVLPDGYIARYFGETISIYKTSGLTNANLGSIVNSTTNEDIINSNKYLYAKGDNVGSLLINDDERLIKSADNTNFMSTLDSSIKDKTSINTLAQEAIKQMKSSDNVYEVNIAPSLLLDKYDGINLIDPTLGVSRTTSIYSLTKDLEMETGSFYENLVLQDK